jgi:erythromycin esterase
VDDVAIGDALIVGLGESVHGAAEILRLKHRVLRLLVERMGVRSVAWEEDWATGRQIDRYIRGGDGDADTLVGRMGGQWQTREVADVLRWLRGYNSGRRDQVRFVGVEYYLTGQPAYDAIDEFVARRAPGRLAAVRVRLDLLRPATPDVYAHIAWYQGQADKRPYRQAAHELLRLVADLDPLIERQARQIVNFYEHFAMSDADALVFRDARAADNVRWWREYSGDKIGYWAASPHTANAPDLRLAPEVRFPSAGSHLRRWYGRRYRSIGFTFDHGELLLGPGQTEVAPPPEPEWFEHPLGAVELDQFALDLGRPAPDAVRRWLTGPITTRGLPGSGPGAQMSGGTLAQWFDVLVHRQVVGPARNSTIAAVSSGAATAAP